MVEGLTGWRKATKPAAWDALAQKLGNSSDAALRDRVRDLSVLFGDGRALDAVKKVALDQSADLNARKAALQTLIDNGAPDLRSLCEHCRRAVPDSVAARGLAGFDDPSIGVKLVTYRQFPPSNAGNCSPSGRAPGLPLALLDLMTEGKLRVRTFPSLRTADSRLR
jgi:hypothetical protein